MTSENYSCQVCGGHVLTEVDGFTVLPRITSDCRPYPAGGKLYVCLVCSSVQKIPDAKWLNEIATIYSGYQAYYQSGGDEQIVFDRISGTPRRRSDVILSHLTASKSLTSRGHAIDIGCGNGATLLAMSNFLENWTFSGYELGDGALLRLCSIPRFVRLFSGALDAISQSFDLVTMIHSLEHFPAPAIVLKQLLPIVGHGKLFIEVPNIEENPFDILVADHLMHFSPATLKRLLNQSGFMTASVATNWVAKEISILSQGGVVDQTYSISIVNNPVSVLSRIQGYVDWLSKLRDLAIKTADGCQHFGIFGTSIAGTWLASQLIDKIAFFVDEDSSRIGKEHLGKPVLHPLAIPKDSRVLVAVAPDIGIAIGERLSQNSPGNWILPLPLAI